MKTAAEALPLAELAAYQEGAVVSRTLLNYWSLSSLFICGKAR